MQSELLLRRRKKSTISRSPANPVALIPGEMGREILK
jgi:hypothetical protein